MQAEKAMDTYRANMRVEGWVFDLENDPNGNDPNGLVGQRCRRFFKQAGTPHFVQIIQIYAYMYIFPHLMCALLYEGKSDGKIVAYLSAAKAEDNVAIYYIEHDDGDQEDIDVLTATKAVNYFVEGMFY